MYASELILIKTIFNQDLEMLRETMNSLHLSGETPNERSFWFFGIDSCRVVSMILSCAAVEANKDGLREEFAAELINNTAKMVNILPFVCAAIIANGVDESDLTEYESGIPTELFNGRLNQVSTEEYEALITNMTKMELLTFLIMVTKKCRRIHPKWNLPIIRSIYENDILYEHEFFALLAGNLCQPTREIKATYQECPLVAIGSQIGDELKQYTENSCDRECENCGCSENCRG